MNLFKFLKSKQFIISLVIALILSVAGVFVLLQWLKKTTNHEKKIEVPALVKLDIDQATQLLSSKELDIVILDTLDYNKEFPPLTIIEQEPTAGTAVKENRKIYVKINASGFGDIVLPKFEEMTYRQALSTIKSMGLREGTISYATFIGRDVVLEVYSNGRKLQKGDRIQKNSRLDFVLGDGKAGLSEEELDTAPSIDDESAAEFGE